MNLYENSIHILFLRQDNMRPRWRCRSYENGYHRAVTPVNRPLEEFAVHKRLTSPFYKHKPPGGAIAGVDNNNTDQLRWSLKGWLQRPDLTGNLTYASSHPSAGPGLSGPTIPGAQLTAIADPVSPRPCVTRRDFKVRRKWKALIDKLRQWRAKEENEGKVEWNQIWSKKTYMWLQELT